MYRVRAHLILFPRLLRVLPRAGWIGLASCIWVGVVPLFFALGIAYAAEEAAIHSPEKQLLGETLAASPLLAEAQLHWIESLYAAGDDFRAESELLRFLHDFPQHPRRAEAWLVGAKLYYRAERWEEASSRLRAILQAESGAAVRAEAFRLLVFSRLHEGHWESARNLESAWRPAETAPLPLSALQDAPPAAVDVDQAVLWSTLLPGAGFFVLERPGAAWGALGLNAGLLWGSTAAYAQNMPGAAALLFLLELGLYLGGREAVREAAERHNATLHKAQLQAWLEREGEKRILQVGFAFSFP